MKNQKKLKVACIGAGYFSQFHYEAWRRIERVELVAAVDLDLEKAKSTGLPAYCDVASMIRESGPDLVDIIVPPNIQAKVIQQCLQLGVKAMICQKPFCESLESALEMVSLCQDYDATLVIHENFRFQPWYREIKKCIEQGVIGELQQITFRLRPGDGQGPEAYLDRQPYFQKMPKFLVHETGVHWIDTFRYLVGEPISVYADLRQCNPVIAGEDAGYMLFNYASGARALFDGNRLLDHAAENTRCTMGEALVEGTKGTLTLKGNGSIHLRTFSEIKTRCVFEAKPWSGFGGDCVYALQQHVVEGLLDEKEIENPGTDYCKNLAIEAAAYRSSEEGIRVDL